MLKRLKNPKIQQYIVELIFPLIGYLVFDWSLLIIIIFYLIDQLGAEIAFWFRLKFVADLFKENTRQLLIIATSLFLIFFGLQIYWLYDMFMNYIYDCQIYYFNKELIDFVKTEFWLLFPLLILIHYIKDKVEFYRSDEPFKNALDKLLKARGVLNLATLLFVLCISFIWTKFKFDELWIIMTVPLVKVGFDLFLLPRIRHNIFKII